jgi:hypothetical protein
MLDIDGTVTPNGRDGIPSKKVTEAIQKASKKVHVSLVTGRPLFLAKPIINHLQISGPCIVTDGTQIYDPITKRFIYETPMKKEAARKVYAILQRHQVNILVNDGRMESEDIDVESPKRVFVIFVPSIPKATADMLITQFKNIPSVTAYKGVDWTPGMEYIAICDIKGTKLHGVMEVAKILNVDTKEIIGVGDGYNDFPLLLACGLKIAMGNAVPELKAIADFIAPSVEEDGVATVIEKFILNQ